MMEDDILEYLMESGPKTVHQIADAFQEDPELVAHFAADLIVDQRVRLEPSDRTIWYLGD